MNCWMMKMKMMMIKTMKKTKEKLAMIFKTKKALRDMPVIANVDFGHTTPMITYPIGGTAQIDTGHGAIVISLQ